MSDDLKVFGKTYSGVTGIQAKDINGNNISYFNGGGGDYDVATGTVTPSANGKTISVDVDFEPTHALIFADFTSWVATSWNEWGVVVFDMSYPRYLSIQARINNDTFQFNPTSRDISAISYSGGKFNFYDSTFQFQAGITYTWYAWREKT